MTTKKEMLDTFAENLEKERIKLGYTQCEFAKKLGISASSYRNIISRRVDTFSIMLAPKLYELTGRFLYEMFGQRSIEIEVLNKFRKLTDRQKAYITAKIEFELEMKAKEEDPANMLDVLLLTGNMEDGMVLDSAHEEHVYCPEYIKKYGEHRTTYIPYISRATSSESRSGRPGTVIHSSWSIKRTGGRTSVNLSSRNRAEWSR